MPLVRNPARPKATTTSAPDVASLRAQLSSGTDEQRWEAARSVVRFPDEVPYIAQALQTETVPRVREALFTALACIATPAGAEAAIAFLRFDDARIRNEALDSLLAMGNVVLKFLPALLSDVNPDIRVLACELVRQMPADEAGTLLAKLLDSEDNANVSAAAVDVLAELSPPAALPALERCAVRHHDTPFLSFAISIAIERIREQAARPRG
jgi:HEAT repeat protein